MSELPKLIEIYSIRITEIMKSCLEKMPDVLKKEMNDELRKVIAQYCHKSNFKLDDWMGEE